MRSNSDLDTQIRNALAEEESELLSHLGDPSLFDMLGDTFRSRLRWLMVLTAFVTAAFFFLSIYCAVRFYNAPDLREMLLWAAALFFCLMAVGLNKTWSWMEMQRNAVTREIKRLELRIAQLEAMLREQG